MDYFIGILDIIRPTTSGIALQRRVGIRGKKHLDGTCFSFKQQQQVWSSAPSSSCSSNVYARLLHQRYKQTIVSARFGGHTEVNAYLTHDEWSEIFF